jgi:G3E family GTPase
VSALWTDDILDNKLRLDGVVCVVDCVHIGQYLSTPDIADDVKTQICYADRILLNKADLINDEQVKSCLHAIYPLVARVYCIMISRIYYIKHDM